MAEHYTRNTLETTAWCNRCGRHTQHAVSCGRIAHCLEHQPQQFTRAQERRREQQARERANPRLFPEEAA